MALLGSPTLFFAQTRTYRWPTNASRVLNSTFGEYRPAHFHSGVDIKTWEKEGFRVFAVRNGYVARIHVSPFGYGKALYLKLDTGEFAVYGHLQRFAPKIERYVRQIQKSRRHYSVDLYPKPNRFPIRRGEVIAFTGRTGIGAPHLHFEIRDALNHPLNPLLKHFRLEDTVWPTITGFGVIPFDRFSQVDGEPLPKIFTVQRVRRGRFRLPHPVQVWGTLGLAVSAYDRTAAIPNKCSVYRLSLELDGHTLFSTQYDSLSFDKTRQIVLDRNYRFISWYHDYFNNLFLLPENELSFYNPRETGAGLLETDPGLLPHVARVFAVSQDGASRKASPNFWAISRLSPGRHVFKVSVSDFYGNQSTLTGTLVAAEKTPTLVKIRQKNEFLQLRPLFSDSLQVAISLNSGKNWQPFTSAGRNSQNDLLFNLPYPVQNRSVLLRIQAIDSLGLLQFPEFYRPFPLPNGHFSLSKVLKRVRFLDDYALYILDLPIPVTFPLFLRYHSGHKSGRSRLLPITPTRFEATVPLDSVAGYNALLFLDLGGKRSHRPLDTLRITKIGLSDEVRLPLDRDGTIIRFRPHAAYQPIFFRFSREPLSAASAPLPGDSITFLLNLQPTDIPLNRGAILNFHIPESETNLGKLAVYSPEKTKWRFQSHYLDPASHSIKVPLRSLGRFTILRDTIPPEITRVFPRPGRKLRTQFPTIRAYFRDNLSGIGGEEAVRVYLDGTFQVSEYDPEMRRVTFVPDQPLQVGKHIAEVRISDRCGNLSRKLWYFYIRKRKK